MAAKYSSRRDSRRKAFELLFELEQHPGLDAAHVLERTFSDEQVSAVYTEDADEEGYVTGPFRRGTQKFIRELVECVADHREEIDEVLARYPQDWSFERIGLPERTLLRLALGEILYIGTSYKVVINESLDLAKMYAEEEAGKFINGILGAAVRDAGMMDQAALEATEDE